MLQTPLIPANTDLPSPVFKPRPGWGGKLKAWYQRNGGVYVLRAVILVALGLTAMALLNNWDARRTAQAVPTLSPSPTPITASDYSFIADHGVGITQLATRALDAYLTDQYVTLNPVEHLYAVDSLARSSGWTTLERGQKVTFSKPTLAAAVISAKALTTTQRISWGRLLHK